MQQDVSEFFLFFWSDIYFVSRTLRENNELCIYEIATCEDCGSQNATILSEDSLHLHCSEEIEEPPLDIPGLIKKSFCKGVRTSRCYSDECDGQDTIQHLKKSLLNVPDILVIQINRFYRQETEYVKNSMPIKIDCTLDLQCALEWAFFLHRIFHYTKVNNFPFFSGKKLLQE